ncbi:TRAP transporter large permease [Ammoniphilus resinae]|uniref:Tripartite ATP-independent transporter DctM subunit n=1 Tax=Ammoniphilus resinae TaxID=861532 RepID=A0ABS4GSJ3_9BACL|nr:TRAP transporter large permease [Ammoniphilus resinae]MBP1933258.1 tripartite ATP-independent transporter DctM subunit [Ammoniphilus resinae]
MILTVGLALAIFIIIGVPISFSMGLAGLLYLWLLPDIPTMVIVQRFVKGADSFPLMAIPMFVLAGSLLNVGGVTRKLIKLASSLVGHIRGGLAQMNVISSMFFAGISGSSNADVAGPGRVLIDGMIEEGYEKEFSAAITASSSVMGPIIPPSTLFIIFGSISMVPVGDLFLGGAIPGILMGILMMAISYYLARKRNYPWHSSFSWKTMWVNVYQSWPTLFTPVIILGGILGGIFTPTEAGVVASAYAFILSAFVYKELKLKDIWIVVSDTVQATAMIMFLVATGLGLSWVLSREQVPKLLVDSITSLSGNTTIILLLVAFVLLVLGMFFSVTSNLIMMVPLLMPLVNILHIDPVHFGVITVLALAIGEVTPPVGAPMFLACKFAKVSIGDFARANMPFYIVLILTLLLVVLFPPLSLWLPSIS